MATLGKESTAKQSEPWKGVAVSAGGLDVSFHQQHGPMKGRRRHSSRAQAPVRPGALALRWPLWPAVGIVVKVLSPCICVWTDVMGGGLFGARCRGHLSAPGTVSDGIQSRDIRPETSEVGTYTGSAGLSGRLSMHRTLPSYLYGTQREEVKLGERLP
jgi:hypothetical protein